MFHQWLKKRRKALDLTHEQLALRVGCSPNTLRKLETGERRPSRDLATRLAAELEISPGDQATFLAFARSGQTGAAMSLQLHQPLEAPPNPDAVLPAPMPLVQLPRPLTRIIGREVELETVRQYLLHDSTRVVTLVGPGGVGKTRLSLEAADNVRDHFRDGVVFVPLATVRNSNLVLSAIARTLGVTDVANRSPESTLHHMLRDRELLLVLDNFEQVVSAAVDLANLIAQCPKLRVLVTSRRPLGIRGEQQLPVFPLPLPDLQRMPSVDELHDVAAVTLFVERVRGVVPKFILTNGNASAIAGICRRLDGLPLAIELVAARCKLLSPQKLLEHLNQSTAGKALDLLTHGPSDLPDRQQTLRQAIRWSYELLDQEQQRLFVWLGCFAGSWTLEAAYAVTHQRQEDSGDNAATDPFDVPAAFFDLLAALLDNHLIHEVVSDGAEQRFAMLETIREYALEQLTLRGEFDLARRMHAAYYRTLVREGRPDKRRAGQSAHFDLLERERPNIHATLEWLIENEPVAAVEVVGDLWWFWYLRSYWVEGNNWIRRVLDRAPSVAPTPTLTNVLTGAGALAWVLADFVEAHHWCEQSLAMGRDLSDHRGVAYASMFLGMTVLRQGDAGSARPLLHESVVRFREVGDLWGLAHALNVLRQAVVAGGDFGAAQVYQRESVDLWRALGDTWGLALALNGLAEIARIQGNPDFAVPLYEESLSLFRGASDTGNTAIVLHNLAHAVLDRGNRQEARRLFTQALQIEYERGSIKGVLECLAGLGAVAVAESQWQEAAHVLGYVHERFRITGLAMCLVDQTVYSRALSLLKMHMDGREQGGAWDEGSQLSLERAVAFAVGERVQSG